MKLLSVLLLSVLAVSLAIPLDSDETSDSDSAVDVSEPVLTNETGDFSEASEAAGGEATQYEATQSEAAQSETVKTEEIFDDTSLEFLDDQPADSRENVVPNEFVSYDGHVISKRSAPVALGNLWESFKELLTWLWIKLLDVLLKPTIAIATFIDDIFNKIQGQLNIGGNRPGEPMVRYNLNGDFNIPSLLNWEYWTTKLVKKLLQN